MPVDAKLQAILNAGKALGIAPIETMTVEEARAERAAMMRRYVPMAEYAGVESRGANDSGWRAFDSCQGVSTGDGERDIAGGGVLSWRWVRGLYAGDA